MSNEALTRNEQLAMKDFWRESLDEGEDAVVGGYEASFIANWRHHRPLRSDFKSPMK
jgi:hypothetical protein